MNNKDEIQNNDGVNKKKSILQRVIFSFVILAITVPPFFLIEYASAPGTIIGMIVFQLIAVLGIYEISTALGFGKLHSAIVTLFTVVASYLIPFDMFEKLLYQRNMNNITDAIEIGFMMSWQVWVFPVVGILLMLLDTRIWSDPKKKGKIAILSISFFVIIIFGKGMWVINIETINFIFYLLPISIISDTFAYFGGMLFGKKWFKGAKFAPKISPKKTWAGFIIGTSFSIGYAIGFGIFSGYWSTFGDLELFVTIAMGIILPIASAFGDLLFSLFKRYLQIKDFSNLIPGHGGVFDRLDALSIVIFISIVTQTIAIAAIH